MSIEKRLDPPAPRRLPSATSTPATTTAGLPNVAMAPITGLRPYGRNARRHSERQLDLIAQSIRSFGFVNPVLIDRDRTIVAGHGRYEAAKRLGLAEVPVVFLDHLTPAEVKA